MAATKQDLNALNAMVTGVRQHCDKRIAHLERRLEVQSEEHARDSDGRERWAEMQGKVNGIHEEMQKLQQHVHTLDQRLSARTGGLELSKQRNRELGEQVQALEQQTRIATAVAEETHKLQAAKLEKLDRASKDVTRRLAKVEELTKLEEYIEDRFASWDQQQAELEDHVRSLQSQLEDGTLGDHSHGQDGGLGIHGGHAVEESIQMTEERVTSLERRLRGDVEHLSSRFDSFVHDFSSLKVTSESSASRLTAIADRMETTVHEPAIEAMRAELAQGIAQHRRDTEGDLSAIRSSLHATKSGHDETAHRLHEFMSNHDETVEDVRKLHDSHARIAAHSLKSKDELSPIIHELQQEVCDVRDRVDMLQLPEESLVTGSAILPADLEHLQSRVDRLEEKVDEPVSRRGAAGDAENSQAHAEGITRKFGEDLSRLAQRASRADEQTNQLRKEIERLQGALEQDSEPSRAVSEVNAKLQAMSNEVIDLKVRLRSADGRLDALHSASGASPDRSDPPERSSNDLHERVADLERRLDRPSSPEPSRMARRVAGVDEVELGKIQARLGSTELAVAELRAEVAGTSALDGLDDEEDLGDEDPENAAAETQGERPEQVEQDRPLRAGRARFRNLNELAGRLGGLEQDVRDKHKDAMDCGKELKDLVELLGSSETSERPGFAPKDLDEVRQDLVETVDLKVRELRVELKELQARQAELLDVPALVKQLLDQEQESLVSLKEFETRVLTQVQSQVQTVSSETRRQEAKAKSSPSSPLAASTPGLASAVIRSKAKALREYRERHAEGAKAEAPDEGASYGDDFEDERSVAESNGISVDDGSVDSS